MISSNGKTCIKNMGVRKNEMPLCFFFLKKPFPDIVYFVLHH